MANKKDLQELYKTIVSLETEKDCEDFLEDLCTYKEVEQFSQRLKAAKLLLDGKTYEQVIAQTDISSATLSRVSKCIKHGKGYNKVLKNAKK